MTALLPLATWVPILDGDPIAAGMYERHYSSARSRARRQARGILQFGGPGERMILSTSCRRALFVWCRRAFRMDEQTGVNCSVFRNEGAGLSSDLIRAADDIADQRWRGERHFTFVNPNATAKRRSVRSAPGECFLRAGWRDTGRRSARGLHILERAV